MSGLSNPFETIDVRLSSIESILLGLSNKTSINQSKPEPDELLTIDEAAAFLKIVKGTIYQRTAKNTIPHVKQGKRLLFLKNELIEWLKEGRKRTASDIATETDAYLSSVKKMRKKA